MILTVLNENDLVVENQVENEGEIENNVTPLKLQLSYWATKHKIKRSAVSDLLKILQKHDSGANLPKDSRTLLKTPRTTNIKYISPGQYYHFDLTSTLLNAIEADIKKYQFKEICIKIGIDGLPISDSNTSQLWPILGCIHPTSRVFMIGVYHGYSKPADSNEFLQAFVDDISILIQEGLTYKEVKFNISIHCLIADAPAKSFITKTKGHTGYFSCTKCEQEGIFIQGRMSFPSTNSKKRTEASFIMQENAEYHLGTSILLNIPNFDIVLDIPLDYMHLVCIGVVKKIISFWIKGPLQVRLSAAKVNIISKSLIQMKPFIVREFARKPQELQCYSNWKATELRQFLLYTGPVVLYQVLPPTLYYHFLSLHIAIRIFCDEKHDVVQLQYAHDLISHFIQSFIVIYGEEFVSHNIHGLIHIKNDVERFGHLDAFSAFPFENFMKNLKTFISKPEKPLQQIHRRYMEIQSSSACNKYEEDQKENKMYHNDGPLIPNISFRDQLRTKQILNWFFSIKNPDNCCHIGRIIIEIHNFAYCNEIAQYVIIGKQFLTVTDFYQKPCPSSNNLCFYVDNLSENFEMWPANEISAKCLRLPHASGFASWCVVEFSDGVQIVPHSWITGDKCYWPTYSGINAQSLFKKAVVEYQAPDKNNWALYAMRILGIYDSYEQAAPKLKKAEIQSDINSSDKDESRSKKSRRVRKRVVHSSEEDNTDPEDEIEGIEPFPTPPTKKANLKITPNSRTDTRISQLPDQDPSPSTSTNKACNSSTFNFFTATPRSLTNPRTTSQTISGGTFKTLKKNLTLENSRNKTNNDITEIKNQLKLLLQTLRERQTDIQENPNTDEINSFREKLPMKTAADVDSWEQILNSVDERKKMVTYHCKKHFESPLH
ncbi:unnamed protein product [Ceutorhynchus assimilis]|uniref:Uncharacterized protein n=1 Tax=Ceutorhynchus assimilis TaxID=467358 RepID=A0A9N9MTP3_9CUCU|nr:unnamed protein product [Ceutorhynchus assimilis]